MDRPINLSQPDPARETRPPAAAFPWHGPGRDAALAEFRARMAGLPAPSSPGFVGQMAPPPHPAALWAYAQMLPFNPNNHDLELAAPTVAMEREAVAELAAMVGLPPSAGGHLTSGGTVANLDGLWHCRQRRPAGGIAFGEEAHFCHERIARLLGAEAVRIACRGDGRMDLDALEAALRGGRIGTVVVSAGTPGLGAVDPIEAVMALRRRYDFGIHVDASYGGFFSLLRDDPGAGIAAGDFAAIAGCDSVAIDPHKHGWQPVGCGCVLYRAGGGFVQDSPYCAAAPLSGLEGSRSGVAAAALWLTLRCLPLKPDEGFGPMLRECLAAARDFAARIAADAAFELAARPALGVVVFRPRRGGTRELAAAAAAEGLRLGVLRRGGGEWLRAVFMQPAQREWLPSFCEALGRLASQAQAGRPAV